MKGFLLIQLKGLRTERVVCCTDCDTELFKYIDLTVGAWPACVALPPPTEYHEYCHILMNINSNITCLEVKV